MLCVRRWLICWEGGRVCEQREKVASVGDREDKVCDGGDRCWSRDSKGRKASTGTTRAVLESSNAGDDARRKRTAGGASAGGKAKGENRRRRSCCRWLQGEKRQKTAEVVAEGRDGGGDADGSKTKKTGDNSRMSSRRQLSEGRRRAAGGKREEGGEKRE